MTKKCRSWPPKVQTLIFDDFYRWRPRGPKPYIVWGQLQQLRALLSPAASQTFAVLVSAAVHARHVQHASVNSRFGERSILEQWFPRAAVLSASAEGMKLIIDRCFAFVAIVDLCKAFT